MPNTKRDIMQHYDWIPTQGEFIRALTLAWFHVGYEAMTLIAYVLKRNAPDNVSASERRTK